MMTCDDADNSPPPQHVTNNNNRFSIMGDPMAMIFGLFSEIYARLLKSITLQFFSRYSKGYINLKCKKLLKTQRLLRKRWAALVPPNYMNLIQLHKCSL